MRCGGRPKRKPFTNLRSATGIKLLSGSNKAPVKAGGSSDNGESDRGKSLCYTEAL